MHTHIHAETSLTHTQARNSFQRKNYEPHIRSCKPKVRKSSPAQHSSAYMQHTRGQSICIDQSQMDH